MGIPRQTPTDWSAGLPVPVAGMKGMLVFAAIFALLGLVLVYAVIAHGMPLGIAAPGLFQLFGSAAACCWGAWVMRRW